MAKRFTVYMGFPGGDMDDAHRRRYHPNCWYGIAIYGTPDGDGPTAWCGLRYETAARARAEVDEMNREYAKRGEGWEP
jgi:hypothetical protein